MSVIPEQDAEVPDIERLLRQPVRFAVEAIVDGRFTIAGSAIERILRICEGNLSRETFIKIEPIITGILIILNDREIEAGATFSDRY